MAKVFISYSRKDIDFAKRLSAELQKCELDFWIDWEGIAPTVDWWKEIEKGIEEADAFLFIISPDSVKSKVCGQEIDHAINNGKRIIPIVVRELDEQESAPQLGHLNYIFFNRGDDFNSATGKLIHAIQTDYEWAATHRRLQVKALDWERNKKDNGFLLRGLDLLDAESDLAANTTKSPYPTNLQREFVLESRKATDKQRRTTTSIALGGVVILAVLAIVAVVMAIRATQQANISRANELAAYSIGLRDRDFQLSLLLGVEAYRALPNVQSKGALFANAQTYPQLQRYISGHADKVTTVAFSPDGNSIASGAANGEIIIWNVSTRTPEGAQPPNQTYPVFSVAFSPDGQSLGISGGGETYLWDLKSGTQGTLYYPNPGFTAFSSDGNTWVAGGYGGFEILDRSAGDVSESFLTPPDLGTVAAFSPNGKTLAYLDSNGNLVLWELLTEEPRAKQQVGIYSTNSLAFSPNGEILASGNSDGSISLWSVGGLDSLSYVATLAGHTSSVTSVAFSPDGSMLASGSVDNSVILWDLSTNKQIGQPLKGHSNSVNSVSFSPDGKTLASGSDDTNIILWGVPMHPTVSHRSIELSEQVDEITFSSDSTTVAMRETSGKVEYWEVATGSRLTDDPPQSNFSKNKSYPDWTTLISEEMLYWYDFVGATHAFDLTGEKLAVGTCGKFDAYNACTEGMITVWDVSTRKQLGSPITGHASQITSLAFSPDGKTLASSGGNTFILWDLETRQLIGSPVSVPSGIIDNLVFSPDGSILAASVYIYPSDTDSGDLTVVLWDLNPESWIEQACMRAGRNFTAKEWTQYFPEEPYTTTRDEATCPQWRLEPQETLLLPITK